MRAGFLGKRSKVSYLSDDEEDRASQPFKALPFYS
jgi:hypothetical protein